MKTWLWVLALNVLSVACNSFLVGLLWSDPIVIVPLAVAAGSVIVSLAVGRSLYSRGRWDA